jgi:hypothetical protein
MTTSPPRPPDDAVASLVASLLADTNPYLSCDECFDRLNEYVEAQLRDQQHTARNTGFEAAMGAHLGGCSACLEEAGALRDLLAQDARTD